MNTLSSNRSSILYLILPLALFFTFCNKENSDDKHQNVVTANINGKPWKAGCKESPPFGCGIGDLQYYTNTGNLELGASDTLGYANIRIRISELFTHGNYKMRDQTQCGIIDKGEPCEITRHYIDENDPQEIEIINIDKENKIIEGKFLFIGRDTNCLSEPVYITNGYFKMKYRP